MGLLETAQTAQTLAERALACVCMLIGASTFAYTVGAICAILASFGEEFKEYVAPPQR
jgi:hypothetical protein